jgi:hypothetical protein
MNIQLEHLAVILSKIVDFYRAVGYKQIELGKDFYWNIPSESLYDVYTTPDTSDFTIGQLFADWDELHKLLDSNPDITTHHIIWLANILRYIGDSME